jgi:hypothetical protein
MWKGEKDARWIVSCWKLRLLWVEVARRGRRDRPPWVRKVRRSQRELDVAAYHARSSEEHQTHVNSRLRLQMIVHAYIVDILFPLTHAGPAEAAIKVPLCLILASPHFRERWHLVWSIGLQKSIHIFWLHLTEIFETPLHAHFRHPVHDQHTHTHDIVF